MRHEELCSPIIERLLCALVDDQRSVELQANCLPGRINWSWIVDVNDTGKVIGKSGVHLRALQLVVELMGKVPGEEWRAKPEDPVGVERSRRPDTETPLTHSALGDYALLMEILTALKINVAGKMGGTIKDGFTFTLTGQQVQHHEALLEAHEAIYERNQKEREPLNLLGALGTIFRAIGRRQGVRYRIDARA